MTIGDCGVTIALVIANRRLPNVEWRLSISPMSDASSQSSIVAFALRDQYQ
jgi:hypothetical protein